ncbi:hypothetical protein LSAT2_032383 [Lamellibrachia satsuma]|nr:hypothetical protein LSAT2_032383 [Lamellibrachia satsuma]
MDEKLWTSTPLCSRVSSSRMKSHKASISPSTSTSRSLYTFELKWLPRPTPHKQLANKTRSTNKFRSRIVRLMSTRRIHATGTGCGDGHA